MPTLATRVGKKRSTTAARRMPGAARRTIAAPTTVAPSSAPPVMVPPPTPATATEALHNTAAPAKEEPLLKNFFAPLEDRDIPPAPTDKQHVDAASIATSPPPKNFFAPLHNDEREKIATPTATSTTVTHRPGATTSGRAVATRRIPARRIAAKTPPVAAKPATPTAVKEAPAAAKPATPTAVKEAPVAAKPATPTAVKEAPVAAKPATPTAVKEAPVAAKPATPTAVKEVEPVVATPSSVVGLTTTTEVGKSSDKVAQRGRAPLTPRQRRLRSQVMTMLRQKKKHHKILQQNANPSNAPPPEPSQPWTVVDERVEEVAVASSVEERGASGKITPNVVADVNPPTPPPISAQQRRRTSARAMIRRYAEVAATRQLRRCAAQPTHTFSPPSQPLLPSSPTVLDQASVVLETIAEEGVVVLQRSSVDVSWGLELRVDTTTGDLMVATLPMNVPGAARVFSPPTCPRSGSWLPLASVNGVAATRRGDVLSMLARCCHVRLAFRRA